MLLQIPFLTADLPTNLSYSRGPYSDEGLNTFAVRNFINSNFTEYSESDNFIKSPVLNAYLFTPFAIFKNDLLAGRIAMILLLGFLFFLAIKKVKSAWLLPLLFASLPMLFHFSRLIMGDILSVFFPLIAILILYYWHKTQKQINFWQLTALTFLAALGVGFKIQAAIVFPTFLIGVFLLPLSGMNTLKKTTAIIAGATPVASVFLFVVAKQEKLFDYIFNQVPEYYEMTDKTLTDIFNQNWDLLVAQPEGVFLVWVWAILAVLVMALMARFKWNTLLKITPFFLLFAIEFSKMFMAYFPPRYALGLFVASLVLLVLLVETCRKPKNILPDIGLVLILVLALVLNGNKLKTDYTHRTFKTHEICKKVAANSKVKVVMGSWAPTFTFYSNRQTAYPVWDSYLNFKGIANPINFYRPQLIIAEPNQDDSAGAYKKRNISLEDYPKTDSLHKGKWKLVLREVK